MSGLGMVPGAIIGAAANTELGKKGLEAAKGKAKDVFKQVTGEEFPNVNPGASQPEASKPDEGKASPFDKKEKPKKPRRQAPKDPGAGPA
jgi:hypothetical protein